MLSEYSVPSSCQRDTQMGAEFASLQPKSGSSAPQVPLSERTTNSVLQISKVVHWDNDLNRDGQDAYACCYKSLPPFSVTVGFPVVKPCRFLCNLCGGGGVVAKSDQRLPQGDPQCWGGSLSSLGSIFPLEEHRTQGRPLSVVLYWPGGGVMWSMFRHFSYLLTQPLLVSVVHGVASASPPCSRILSVMSSSSAALSCSSCDGKQSQKWFMLPSW